MFLRFCKCGAPMSGVIQPDDAARGAGVGADNADGGGVWVLTDGKIGDDVQCLAVAAALDPAFEKRVVAPGLVWSLAAPWGPVAPRDRPGAPHSPISGAPPSIVVASGRRAIPYARYLKKISGGRTKIVVLKDPRWRREAADVIWTPAHDGLAQAASKPGNVFSTLTSPHGLSAAIANATGAPGEVIAGLRSPFLGVVLGGPSGGARYGHEEAMALARALTDAARGFQGIAVTPSRRTPPAFIEAFRAGFRHDNAFIWNGVGDNPYIDILANAKALVVAADSHNMMSEALCSRVGVYAWRPPGLARKMAWFVDQLEARGDIKPFIGASPPFDRQPVNATVEIVVEIKRRIGVAST